MKGTTMDGWRVKCITEPHGSGKEVTTMAENLENYADGQLIKDYMDIRSVVTSDQPCFGTADLSMMNLLVQEMLERKTTYLYWDCECDHDYIHPKLEQMCLKCGARPNSQPDSDFKEVMDGIVDGRLQFPPLQEEDWNTKWLRTEYDQTDPSAHPHIDDDIKNFAKNIAAIGLEGHGGQLGNVFRIILDMERWGSRIYLAVRR
jgi:hypothetical protein